MLVVYTIDSNNGHTPILPAQKSIIITIFTISGVDTERYVGASPVLPRDEAVIVNAIWKSLQKIAIAIKLAMNIRMYDIT